MNLALSLAGGGIRGILPCCMLMELERRTGKLTRDVAMMVSGTSTGALLAGAVAAGIPAKDLLKVYTDRSKEIFKPNGIIAAGLRVARGYMYDPSNLQKVLVDVLGKDASRWTMDHCPIRVMITAVDMAGHVWFFVKGNDFNSKVTANVPLVDAMVASAAAPTYFSNWRINTPIDGKIRRFYDGGVGCVANPSYQTCVELFSYDSGFTTENTRVLALGTGFYPAPDDPPNGLIATIGWSFDTLIDTADDDQDSAARRHYGSVLNKINPMLPRAIAMDDLSSIPDLVEIGKKAAQTIDWSEYGL